MGLTSSTCFVGVRHDEYDDDGGYDVFLHNADDCGVFAVDIKILQPFELTDDSGATDGEITFSVQSGIAYDDLEYTIDNWATSGTFNSAYGATKTGLAAGTYTLKVRHDTTTSWEVETTFIIETIPSYGTRWRLTYDDMQGFSTQIDIQEKDYSGSVTEICGAADPLEWEYRESGDKFTVLKPMRARLRLISESDGQFDDIIDGDENEYRIKINKQGQVKFYLYILTEHTTIPHRDAPYSVEFVASDRIATLKNIDFASRTGARFNRLITVFDLMRRMLRDALTLDGVDFNYEVYMPLKQDNHGTLTPAIDQTYINCEQYINEDGTFMNMYDVLIDILKPYGVRLMLSPGFNLSWSVQQIKDISGTVGVFRYTGSTGLWSTTNKSLEGTLSLTPSPTGINFVNNNQVESYQPGVESVTVRYNIQKNLSLIPWGDFGSANRWEDSATLAFGWGGDASISRGRYFDPTNREQTEIYEIEFSSVGSLASADYIKSLPVLFEVDASNEGRVYLKIKFQIQESATPPTYWQLIISVHCGGYYLNENGYWTAYNSSTDALTDHVMILNFSQPGFNGTYAEFEYEILTQPLPADTGTRFKEAQIRIYEPVNDFGAGENYTYFIQEVIMEYVPYDDNIPENVDYTYENSGSYRAQLDPIETTQGYFGDVQNSTNIIIGQQRDSDGVAVTDWEQTGETGTFDLLDILAARIYQERSVRRRVIRGSIRGLIYIHGQLVYDGSNWLIDGLKRSDKNGISEITMLEMSSTMGWPT